MSRSSGKFLCISWVPENMDCSPVDSLEKNIKERRTSKSLVNLCQIVWLLTCTSRSCKNCTCAISIEEGFRNGMFRQCGQCMHTQEVGYIPTKLSRRGMGERRRVAFSGESSPRNLSKEEIINVCRYAIFSHRHNLNAVVITYVFRFTPIPVKTLWTASFRETIHQKYMHVAQSGNLCGKRGNVPSKKKPPFSETDEELSNSLRYQSAA